MKLAVLADIHSNHIALEKCVAKLKEKEADAICMMGDYVGELAYPQKTMKIIYELQKTYPTILLRGNKEDYYINYINAGEVKNSDLDWKKFDSTTGCLFYAVNNLEKEDIDFFTGLNISTSVKGIDSPAITFCHGTQESNRSAIRDNDFYSNELIENDPNSIIVCAHSHVQFALKRNGKLAINPGSVGMPHGLNGRTQFAMIYTGDDAKRFTESDEGTYESLEKRSEIIVSNGIVVELLAYDYDKEAVIKEMEEEGLFKFAPAWSQISAKILRGENVCHSDVLHKAMSLQHEEVGNCKWPYIDEKYWEKAFIETA